MIVELRAIDWIGTDHNGGMSDKPPDSLRQPAPSKMSLLDEDDDMVEQMEDLTGIPGGTIEEAIGEASEDGSRVPSGNSDPEIDTSRTETTD